MTLSIFIFVINLVSTFCLVGLIWTIQVVHYPSFIYVDKRRFLEMEAFHKRRITIIVMPLMLVELLSSLLLLWNQPEFFTSFAALFGVLLVGIIWLSTFAIQVPIHGDLSLSMNEMAIHRLVVTNWIRTIAWTARGLLLAWVILSALSTG